MPAPRCIVTRPLAQAGPWVDALRAGGIAAVALPLIAIAPLTDPAALHTAWATLGRRALVMFVSANAVQHFFAARPACAGPWPAGVLAGSTGPGTSAALREAGVPEAALVEPPPAGGRYDTETLWLQLQSRDWAGARVLVVRGEDGRDWLAETLRCRGAQVDFIAAYRRLPPPADAATGALLAAAQAAPADHLWLFSSSEAVGHLRALAPAADWRAARALASHPRIAAAARAAGFGQVDALPATPAALVQWLQGRPPPAASINSALPEGDPR